MDFQKQINEITGFKNLELLATQVVEGFISGLHKSPFHGYSAEFAEHKVYNPGESTRHIDWRLYAKTDKLFTKHYEEETNLRCHIIVDNSGSMHYPEMDEFSLNSLNKIAFSALASAAVMQLLKRQRDAVGLSLFSDRHEFYAPEKGSERHHRMLLYKLGEAVSQKTKNNPTKLYKHMHLIAEKMKRRSLVLLFSDMFQADLEEEKIFEALRHLKYNKHEVVLFHVTDHKQELEFDYDNRPRRFVDVETGERIDLYPETVRENYRKAVGDYFSELRLKCAQYRIQYVEADINRDFSNILTTYLIERQKFK